MPLSNATQQTLLTQYFDDWYAPSNTDPTITEGEDFDFHRILFRPKFPVQSRELTQLQTLLSHQLERLGTSSCHEGEAVLGGQLTLDTSVTSGLVLPTSNVAAMFDRDTNVGKNVFVTVTPTIKGHVLQYVSTDDGETTNNYVIFKQQTATDFSPSSVID